jgi:multiple sugar transport system substrate-binding protein
VHDQRESGDESTASLGGAGITRRQILKSGAGIGGAFVAAPLLAACGDDDDDDGGQRRGTGEVVIGAFEDTAFVPFKEEIFPAFESATGISVKFLEDEYGTFFEKGLNDGRQEGGQYDIYIMDDPWVPEYAASGILVDLGAEGVELEGVAEPWAELGYWPPRTGPRTTDFVDAEPQLFATPTIGDMTALYWRNDLLSEAPTTWSELVEVAKAHHDPGARQYGFAAAADAGIGAFATFYVLLSTFGGTLFDDEWNVTFNDATGQAAAEFFVTDLKSVAPPAIGEQSLEQVGTQLFGGRAALGLGFTGFAKLAADPKESKVVDTLASAAVPAGEGGTSRAQSGIYISGVSKSAPNRENALRFVEWYLQEDTQRRVARAGAVPVRTSALEDAEAQSQSPILKTVSEQIDLGLATLPRSPDLFAAVLEPLSTNMNKAAIRGSVGDALETAAQQTTDFLTKQKVYYG